MGYKMPIVCKDIYLPIENGDDLSLQEYQEKYGIDLRPFISLSDTGFIDVNFGYSKVYIVNEAVYSVIIGSAVAKILNIGKTEYIANSQDATSLLTADLNGDYSLELIVPQDEEFIIDNVKVVYFEA